MPRKNSQVLSLLCLFALTSCGDKVTHQNIENTQTKSEIQLPSKKEAAFGEALYSQEGRDLKENFILLQGKYPDKGSRDYFSVVQKISNEDSTKKNIFVSGLQVRLAEHSATDIVISKGIQNIVIDAEELIIAREVNFFGANVIINASLLKFEGEGKIITTPEDYNKRASNTENGLQGQKGGDITLNVENIDFGTRKVRFDLSGGKGQAAGVGIRGENGKHVSAIDGKNAIQRCDRVTYTCVPASDLRSLDFSLSKKTEIQNCTLNGIPTNGKTGVSAGHPGAGGNGGTLKTSTDLLRIKDFVVAKAGEIGQSAPDTLGGEAGTPQKYTTIYVEKNENIPCGGSHGGKPSLRNSSGGKHLAGETKDGEIIVSPTVALGRGHEGNVELIAIANSFNDGIKKHALNYIKDLYRNGYFQDARKRLLSLQNILTTDSSYDLAVSNEVKQLQAQLDSNLDVNGEELNLVPSLSFNKIINIYKKSIENAIEVMAFTSKSLKAIEGVKGKNKKYRVNYLEYSELLDRSATDFAKSSSQIDDVNYQLKNVTSKLESFNKTLARVEQDINQAAQNNIENRERRRKRLGALKALAGLVQAFPLGQPATGVIGGSLSNVMALTQKEDASVMDVLKQSKQVYENISEIDWKKSKEDWNQKYRQFDYDKFKEAQEGNGRKVFERYAKNLINTSKPIYAEVEKYYEDLQNNKIPQSEYEREVQRIKNEHAEFQYLVKELNDIQQSKRDLHSALSIHMANMKASEVYILESLAGLMTNEEAQENLLDGLDFSVESTLKTMEKKAKGNLLKYRNMLIKSYQYRLATAWPGNLDLVQFEKKISDFFGKADKEISNEELKGAYLLDLKEVTNSLVSYVRDGKNSEFDQESFITLNSGELAALKNGNEIVLDLSKRVGNREREENRRLVSIELEDVDLLSSKKDGILDIKFRHEGYSVIKKNRSNYVFKHDNTSLLTWSSRLHYENGTVSHSSLSKDYKSFLGLFLEQELDEEFLYERAGVDSKIFAKIEASVEDLKMLDELNYLKIKVKYTYSTAE